MNDKKLYGFYLYTGHPDGHPRYFDAMDDFMEQESARTILELMITHRNIQKFDVSDEDSQNFKNMTSEWFVDNVVLSDASESLTKVIHNNTVDELHKFLAGEKVYFYSTSKKYEDEESWETLVKWFGDNSLTLIKDDHLYTVANAEHFLWQLGGDFYKYVEISGVVESEQNRNDEIDPALPLFTRNV